MKLILHMIKKDFRHLRLFLFVWWGLLISRTALIASTLFGQIEEEHTFFSQYWLEMSVHSLGSLTFLFLFPLVLRLVLSDTPVGSSAFWMSRPISGSRLLLCKSLFLVLTVIIPILLAEVWLLLSQGVTQIDVLRSVPQIILLNLVGPALFMMITVVNPGRNQETESPWPGTIATLSLIWIIVSLNNVLDLTYETLSTSRSIVLILFLLAIAGFVIADQYSNRRSRLSANIATFGILLCGFVVQVWPWDFVAAAQRPDRSVMDPQHVTAGIETRSLRVDRPVNPWLAERSHSLVLIGTIVLENVPADLVVVPERIVAHASFRPAAPVISHEHRNRYIAQNARFWVGDPSLMIDMRSRDVVRNALGPVNFLDATRYVDADHYFPAYLPELLSISEDSFQRHGGIGAVYSAEVDFLIQGDEIARLRLEEGERYIGGSVHAEILRVQARNEILAVELKESRHSVVPDHHNYRRYVLHNRSKREVLLGDERTFSGVSTLSGWEFFPPMLKIHRTTLIFTLPSTDPPVDPDWFQDAELVRIETRNLGRFSKTIRMESLVLKDIPGP